MKRFLRAIAGFFRRFFTPEFRALIMAGLQSSAPYIQAAYNFATVAAALTPNRTDDELVALAKQWGIPNLWDADTDKGVVIGRMVAQALRRRYPDATDRAINRAIEIAYGAVKP